MERGEHLARKSWRGKCVRLCVCTCVRSLRIISALRPRCPPLVGKTDGAFAGAMHSGMHCVAGQRCKL